MTVDKHTHELARPFVVLATQNPIEYEGTYPLPEAQLDRFMVRVSLGYPTAEQETDMLADHGERDRVLDLEPVADVGDVLAAQVAAGAVHGSEALRRYIVAILRGHARGPARGARRQPARRADALPGGEGQGRAGRPRPRAPRRRPGARRIGPQPPAPARAGCRRATSARPWCADALDAGPGPLTPGRP